MADQPDRSTPHPPLPPSVTRRDFFNRSSRIAIGLAALRLGVGRDALAEGMTPLSQRPPILPARATTVADELTLGNDAITAIWTTTGGVFRPVRMTDGLNKAALPISAQAFVLTFADR